MNVLKRSLDSTASTATSTQMLNIQQVLALKERSSQPQPKALTTLAKGMHFQSHAFVESDDETHESSYSDISHSDDDSMCDSVDYTTSDDERETVEAKAMVKAAFSRTLSVPAFCQLMGHPSTPTDAPAPTTAERAPKRTRPSPSLELPPPTKPLRVPMVNSAPALKLLVPNSPTSPKLQRGISSNNVTLPLTKPDVYLQSLLASAGAPTKTFCALEQKDFFLKVTTESVESYDMQVVKAVRNEDVDALRQMLVSGRTLQCGNKFGESIVHTACRRGSVPVLGFLLHEADVSCRVICDYGRTPLHDACWTSGSGSGEHDQRPNFELIDMILEACPDLLHVKDARGFLPLAYVRREHWNDWCQYFNQKTVDQLAARELH